MHARKRRSYKLSAMAALALALAAAACTQDGGGAAQPDAAGREKSETVAAGTGAEDGPTAALRPDADADGEAGESGDGARPAVSVSVPVAGEVLAEAWLDADGDGAEERLVIRMTKGVKREETEPGPFMGTVREGDVRIELLDAGGAVLHARDVNPDFGGQPLVFDERRDFTLWIDDYNGDGRPEFTLGQYMSSNGFAYSLYDVSADGIRLLWAGIYSGVQAYSKTFRRIGARAFENDFYNMETGLHEKSVYVWQDGRYVRVTDPDAACDGCRRWDIGGAALVYAPTEDGFVLAADRHIYGGFLHLSPPVGGKTYIIQDLITDEAGGVNAGWIFNTAVIVDAAAGGVRVVPLYAAETANLYQAHGIARGHGFLPDGSWVFVAAESGGEAGTRYQLKKLDPATGETAVLVPELPGAEEMHYATSWLTRDGSSFVMVGNETGRMWVADLADGTVTLLKDRFAMGWPFVFVHSSPDGERFWYEDHEREEFRVYDLAGNVLAAVPFPQGFTNHPAVRWSLDGRYAVLPETFDKDLRHIIGNDGETDLAAPERLTFFDRDGRLVRVLERDADGESVDLAGWPAAGGGTVLVERYRLSDETDERGHRIKTGRRFALLDLKTGRETGLTLVDGPAPARVTGVFAGSPHGPFALVDGKSGQVALPAIDWHPVTSDEGTLAWTVTDWETRKSRLYLWDAKNGRLTEWDIPAIDEFHAVAGGKWWYTSGKAFHRLPEPASRR